MRGFEPPTPASRTQCSTRLSHTPTVGMGHKASPRSEDAAYSHGFERPQAPISTFFAQTENSRERGCCIPNRFGLSDRLRRTERCGNAGPAGEWCNGNTTVFGTVILGSSPSSPATALTAFERLRAPPRGVGFTAGFTVARLFQPSSSRAIMPNPIASPVT